MADPETAVPRSPDGQGGVQVIARVGQVLRALDGETQGLSLAQLADRVGLPRSTVHRIVTALVAEGLIAAFKKENVENLTMLWVKAEQAREE